MGYRGRGNGGASPVWRWSVYRYQRRAVQRERSSGNETVDGFSIVARVGRPRYDRNGRDDPRWNESYRGVECTSGSEQNFFVGWKREEGNDKASQMVSVADMGRRSAHSRLQVSQFPQTSVLCLERNVRSQGRPRRLQVRGIHRRRLRIAIPGNHLPWDPMHELWNASLNRRIDHRSPHRKVSNPFSPPFTSHPNIFTTSSKIEFPFRPTTTLCPGRSPTASWLFPGAPGRRDPEAHLEQQDHGRHRLRLPLRLDHPNIPPFPPPPSISIKFGIFLVEVRLFSPLWSGFMAHISTGCRESVTRRFLMIQPDSSEGQGSRIQITDAPSSHRRQDAKTCLPLSYDSTGLTLPICEPEADHESKKMTWKANKMYTAFGFADTAGGVALYQKWASLDGRMVAGKVTIHCHPLTLSLRYHPVTSSPSSPIPNNSPFGLVSLALRQIVRHPPPRSSSVQKVSMRRAR